MSKTLYPALVLVICLWSSPAISADLARGLEAFKRADYKTALKEWTPLAEQGDALAQFNLGGMYDSGRGVAQDYKTAVKWYKLAAEQGEALAQYNLGLMYDEGQGVAQDYTYAHMWLNIAGSLGNKLARKARDSVAKTMSPSQLETAQNLARECVNKKYKGCD